MMIDPHSLGATLYVPATHGNLRAIVSGVRFPELRSIVVCLEDSLRADEVERALVALRLALTEDEPADAPLLFVRPRDLEMLRRIVEWPEVARISGFVIPKATGKNVADYLRVTEACGLPLMPILETRDAFDPFAVRALRDQLLEVKPRILAIRIGGNDLLQALGVRRQQGATAYGGPLGVVIANLATSFIPWGFAMSAPVFEQFGRSDLLAAEVESDLAHGLSSKTIIHPSQAGTVHACYQVDMDELETARAILDDDAKAVFAIDRTMIEPATHRRWAETIVSRAGWFGTRSAESPLHLVG